MDKVATTNYVEIEQLRPYTNYSFCVRAYNIEGASPQSNTVYLITEQDGRYTYNQPVSYIMPFFTH